MALTPAGRKAVEEIRAVLLAPPPLSTEPGQEAELGPPQTSTSAGETGAELKEEKGLKKGLGIAALDPVVARLLPKLVDGQVLEVLEAARLEVLEAARKDKLKCVAGPCAGRGGRGSRWGMLPTAGSA